MRSSDFNISAAACSLGDGAVGQLERVFSERLAGHFQCLSIANATCGLAAVLRCLPPGDVIAPLFTSPATFASVEHAGHRLRYCDVDPVSACLSPDVVVRQLNRNIRAILSVNIFGHQSDLMRLRQLADAVDALLLLDAAQSTATCLMDPALTALADVVVFSFGSGKFLNCFDGGLIAVKGQELWEELVLSTQSVPRQILDVPARSPNLRAFNYRIHPVSAAQALSALVEIDARMTQTYHDQQQVIEQLQGSGCFATLPKAQIVFEPLTVLPLQPLNGYCTAALPIPTLVQLAQELQLPETLRQYRQRRRLVV